MPLDTPGTFLPITGGSDKITFTALTLLNGIYCTVVIELYNNDNDILAYHWRGGSSMQQTKYKLVKNLS